MHMYFTKDELFTDFLHSNHNVIQLDNETEINND